MKRSVYALAVLGLLVLLLSTLLAACGTAGDEPELDGQALVQERCSECHDLARVQSASKSRQEWQSTVERMVELGAELNEAEQAAVVDYLAETYPE